MPVIKEFPNLQQYRQIFAIESGTLKDTYYHELQICTN